MQAKTKLLIWEIACIFWIAFAGSLLHFAYELSEYWKPMALLAAVNESVWEHIKMYFWPGVAFALAQYTYSREYHHNYWFGKAAALAITPITIIVLYHGYIGFSNVAGYQPSLGIMLGIMFLGIAAGQMISWRILSAEPFTTQKLRYAPAMLAVLIGMFSMFTYFPPKIFLFENFACYQYTGEYGILQDYEPYRIFTRVDENGDMQAGAGVNYCAEIEARNLVRGQQAL